MRVQVQVGDRDPVTEEIRGDHPLKIRADSSGLIHLQAVDELRVDHWEVVGGGGNALIWLLPLLCLLIPLMIGGVMLLIRGAGD
jgi:hypothetical protein